MSDNSNIRVGTIFTARIPFRPKSKNPILLGQLCRIVTVTDRHVVVVDAILGDNSTPIPVPRDMITEMIG